MISTNERILQNRVNQLNDQLFDLRLQNQKLRKYIDLLENKLSDKDTDLIILQNQINYLVRRNRQKKKY
jgi:predicted  nucleic acid-binding Zn-ribbon protein